MTTIRVTPERSTLSLSANRLRTEDSRGPAGLGSKLPDAKPAAGAPAAPKTADAAALRATTLQLDRASSIADTTAAALGSLSDLLERLRDAATAARDSGTEAGPELRALSARITETVRGAAFDGVNLLDGSLASGAFRLPASADGTGELALTARDLTPGGPHVPFDLENDVFAVEGAEAALADVGAFRGQLSEDAKRIDAHRSFVSVLADVVGGSGGGGLGIEGARLAALQLKQTLSGQTLSIANQAPQTVLSLFR